MSERIERYGGCGLFDGRECWGACGRDSDTGEEWQRLVVNALNNLKKESKEHLITTVDGQEKITVHTATRWARDTAMNGCRLFGVFAADPKRREDFAEEAIKACLVVLAFCDESATVCSAACDCLYNYCYRCEFAAL